MIGEPFVDNIQQEKANEEYLLSCHIKEIYGGSKATSGQMPVATEIHDSLYKALRKYDLGKTQIGAEAPERGPKGYLSDVVGNAKNGSWGRYFTDRHNIQNRLAWKMYTILQKSHWVP